MGPTDRSLSIAATGIGAAGVRSISVGALEAAYREQARGLMDGGCDLLLVETVFDVLNAHAALAAIGEACLERKRQLPVMVSAAVSGPDGRTLAGQTIETFWTAVAGAGPLSVGLNCSPAARGIRPHLELLARLADCCVSVHPSAGLPNALGEYADDPAVFAGVLRDLAASRLVNIVGGCCGTTPGHIRAIVEAVSDQTPRAKPSRRNVL
jgi:5-methyltetrahydrofolate--homocysteine methyltransferase